MTESTDQNGISRRTVVKTAAWAAPVVAVTAAAPAFAEGSVDLIPTDGWIQARGQNGQANRRIDVGLQNAGFENVPFPAGAAATVTITISGTGTWTPTGVTGGTYVSGTSYTFNVTSGAADLRWSGNLTGTITASAVINVVGYTPFTTADTTLIGV